MSCGILRRLWDQLEGRLDVLFLFDLEAGRTQYAFDLACWPEETAGIRVAIEADAWCKAAKDTAGLRLRRAVDKWLDNRFGFFSLALRFNRRHGFLVQRMAPGHRNPFLDSRRCRPFPHSRWLYNRLFDWYFGPRRFIEPALTGYMARNTSALIASNLQFRSAQPYLVAARRLGIPVVGNIASWDHPVGKGVVFPWCRRYIVQNDYMYRVLQEYHGIAPERICITGWPQTDIFVKPRPRSDYEMLLSSFGLEPARQCVLVTGNTENNNPREPVFVERLIEHIDKVTPGSRPNLIFRPHPKDKNWRTRFAGLNGRTGVYLQAASFSDTEVLALLLQHVDCVVTNAGTVLLDSLVNDRAVVCVLYDESGDSDDDLAGKNVTGHHYIDLMQSGGFVEARSMDEVVEGVRRCLRDPGELRTQRKAIVEKTVGVMDGNAAARVVQEMVAGFQG